MGSWFSSDDKSTTENKGVSQNVVIANDDPIKFHNQEILFMLYLIAIIKILELVYYFLKNYKQELKERFSRNINV